MIGHASLRIVVGADAFAAVAGADLAFACVGNGVALLLLFELQNLAAQHAQGFIFVFVLAALVLTFHHNAGGQVGDADGGFGFVDMLAAGAAGTEGVDLQIGGIELHIYVLGFGQHSHRCGGRMDPALRFRFGHALHAVDAAFKFKARPCAVADHKKADLLEAAELRGVFAEHFDFEALAFGIHCIHAEQHRRKQRRFFAARAAADFDDDVFVVVFVLRQQQDFQFLLQFVERLLLCVIFLLRQCAEIFVETAGVQQSLCFVKRLLRGQIAHKAVDDRLQLFALFHQRRVTGGVADDRRVAKLLFHFVKPRFDGIEFIDHGSSCGRVILRIFFSALARGIIISWPQPRHLSLKSMPERKTSNSAAPHGCFFFIVRISPTRTSTFDRLLC